MRLLNHHFGQATEYLLHLWLPGLLMRGRFESLSLRIVMPATLKIHFYNKFIINILIEKLVTDALYGIRREYHLVDPIFELWLDRKYGNHEIKTQA